LHTDANFLFATAAIFRGASREKRGSPGRGESCGVNELSARNSAHLF
jgi:hypothetical protein